MKGDFTRNTFNPANQFTRVLQQQGRVQLDADWNEQTSILLHYLWALATDLIGPFGGPGGGGFKIIGLSGGNSPDFKIGNGRYYVAGRLCENNTIDPSVNAAEARNAAQAVASAATGANAAAAAAEARRKADTYTAEPAKSAADAVARAAQAAAAQPGATAATVQQAAMDAVAGAVVDATAGLRYTYQTPSPAFELEDDSGYLVYLDVWERHVSYLETDSLIREVALGGPDTATRAQLVWQVRASDRFIKIENNEGQEEIREIDVSPDLTPQAVRDRWQAWVRYRNGNLNERGRLQVKAGEVQNDTAACVIPPGSRYRGLENQLYRVEIHQGSNEEGKQPTFKFSRENGSAVFPLAREVNGEEIWLKHLGRDDRFGLQRGDWVEVVDDAYTLQNRVGELLEVSEINPLDRTVTLSKSPADVGDDLELHPYLRRWDHREGLNGAEGGLTLEKGAAQLNPGSWLKLEDGIEIRFQNDGIYHTGDYWLIPARTATGNIEWPDENEPVPPHGTAHYYAPLAIIRFDGNDLPADNIEDCRLVFPPLAMPPTP